jgi:hypothetical protein
MELDRPIRSGNVSWGAGGSRRVARSLGYTVYDSHIVVPTKAGTHNHRL